MDIQHKETTEQRIGLIVTLLGILLLTWSFLMLGNFQRTYRDVTLKDIIEARTGVTHIEDVKEDITVMGRGYAAFSDEAGFILLVLVSSTLIIFLGVVIFCVEVVNARNKVIEDIQHRLTS